METASLITVVGGNTATLSQMLEHYQSLGLENFVIQALGATCEDESLSTISKAVEEFGAKLYSTNVGSWAANVNEFLYALPRNSRPNEWFILADHDEFQVYPDSLPDLISYCERKGYDYIEGCLIDRISEDGKLSTIGSQESVWRKFPLGGMMSARLLGAVTNKIVAAKGHVRIIVGQHLALSGNGCPPNEIYIPVHHFKWTAGALEDLRARIERRDAIAARNRYAEECKAFVRHFESNGGRIDVNDERLFIARCAPDYPHWQKILEWRYAAAWFSPQLPRFHV